MKSTRRDFIDDDLDALERLLTSSLRPVEMRPDFRDGLHTRLAHSPIPPKTRLTIMQYVILSLGSVAATTLLFVALVYTLRSILAALGYMEMAKK